MKVCMHHSTVHIFEVVSPQLSAQPFCAGPPPPQWPQASSLSEREDLLRAWVSSHGGWISSSLELAKSPTCNGMCGRCCACHTNMPVAVLQCN
jgi:hypothetical protein